MPQIRDARLDRNQRVGQLVDMKDLIVKKIGVLPGMECAVLVRVSSDPERDQS